MQSGWLIYFLQVMKVEEGMTPEMWVNKEAFCKLYLIYKVLYMEHFGFTILSLALDDWIY